MVRGQDLKLDESNPEKSGFCFCFFGAVRGAMHEMVQCMDESNPEKSGFCFCFLGAVRGAMHGDIVIASFKGSEINKKKFLT